jgi:ribulose 1,5-bisphosphate synthetase/thiazole synthase
MQVPSCNNHALDNVVGTAALPMPDISGCEVLVVGGPAGMTLAIDLAWRGIHVIVVQTGGRSSRCRGSIPRSM